MFNLITKVDLFDLTDSDILKLLHYASLDFLHVSKDDMKVVSHPDGYIVSTKVFGDIELEFDDVDLTIRVDGLREIELHLERVRLEVSKNRYNRREYTLADFLKSFDIDRMLATILDYLHWQLDTEIETYDSVVGTVLQEFSDKAIDELRENIDVFNVLSAENHIGHLLEFLESDSYYRDVFIKQVESQYKKFITIVG